MEDDGARHVDDERMHDLFLKQVQEVVAIEPGFGGTACRLKRESFARLSRYPDDMTWLGYLRDSRFDSPGLGYVRLHGAEQNLQIVAEAGGVVQLDRLIVQRQRNALHSRAEEIADRQRANGTVMCAYRSSRAAALHGQDR